jgi:methionine aminopeptidase
MFACRDASIKNGNGGMDAAGLKLIDTTIHATRSAIAHCGPGVKINKIGDIISEIAEANGYSNVGVSMNSTMHKLSFLLG